MLAAAVSDGSPTWTDIQTGPEVNGEATYILNFGTPLSIFETIVVTLTLRSI